MMKKLMLGAALSALIVSGALAQAPNVQPTPPATAQKSTPPAAAEKSSPPATAKNDQASQPKFVASQKPDQFLASNFKGTDVIGGDGKKIGDVSDILFDKDGKIEAYVISVGGFLGMGAKEVAMPPTAFQVTTGKNNEKKLQLAMTQKELKQAQNFTPYSPPRPAASTTGSGGGLGAGPMSGGMHPPGGGLK
jgi:sporulation protein YlmC with PRC-barrel domain